MDTKEHYLSQVVPAFQEKFGLSNKMSVPRVVKIVLNVGLSSGSKDAKNIQSSKETLRIIAGQEPVERKAKKSIAGFKIRKGQVVGLTVTLRGKRMYDFISKLMNVALPRIRDFRGLRPESLDSRGNLTIGFKEAISFPEVKAGDTERQNGLEITVTTNARTHERGLALLKLMGFPFKN